MFKTNEYFDGNVKSMSFNTAEGPATIGLMAVGEFEFGTSSKEIMTITSGKLQVKLPGSDEWKSYKQNETFIIEANKKFAVIAKEEISYLCLYK
ncbi:pyrimidine/purine nucleoside phosphorylase [Clostridium estertheticum]|uniref:pyrimidine/purine nucleoside phosphorylase n=1 Tax=Clostridium estertheticum TaxID=238834 RepID=UPI0013E8FEF8|nr:pyrimidine/purine nucleoside phosphorylase [Clostridium estertheticum]MBZ9686116.1 pyrimidine/purine nucleoside phosphorylase [Clostridium estertheticum]